MQTSRSRDYITVELFGLKSEQMWQVYLDFKKRGGCSYSDRICVARVAIYAESLDGNKLKNGWIE